MGKVKGKGIMEKIRDGCFQEYEKIMSTGGNFEVLIIIGQKL